MRGGRREDTREEGGRTGRRKDRKEGEKRWKERRGSGRCSIATTNQNVHLLKTVKFLAPMADLPVSTLVRMHCMGWRVVCLPEPVSPAS